jgi:tripartite-type tricarboxylate transporter receptor subunit TctC
VIELSRQPIALAAHPSLGVTTLSELTKLVKQQPSLGFATGSGAGSSQAMVGLWYAKLAGIKLEQVPYRGGGQAINDLVAGHVKLGSLGSTPLIPYNKTGGLIPTCAVDGYPLAGAAERADISGSRHRWACPRSADRNVFTRGHSDRHRLPSQH